VNPSLLDRIFQRAGALLGSGAADRRDALRLAAQQIAAADKIKLERSPPIAAAEGNDPGWAKRTLFEKIMNMHHAIVAADAREADKTKTVVAPAVPVQPTRNAALPPATAVAAPAPPPEVMTPTMLAGITGFYNPSGSGGTNINHEFPPDVVRENWLASQNQPAPCKVSRMRGLDWDLIRAEH
jgi:hypothetical protein